MRFEVLTAPKILWAATPCVTIFRPEDEESVSPKRSYLPASPYGVTAQKTKSDVKCPNHL
jgi:hypothetical protein